MHTTMYTVDVRLPSSYGTLGGVSDEDMFEFQDVDIQQ